LAMFTDQAGDGIWVDYARLRTPFPSPVHDVVGQAQQRLNDAANTEPVGSAGKSH